MRLTIFVFILCLLNFSVLNADDDDIDEDISMEDGPPIQPSANIAKGNVPTIKSASSNIYFEEQFQEKSKWSRWVKSQAKKDDVEDNLAKYDGEWALEIPQSSVYNDDYALILKVNSSVEKIFRSNEYFDFSRKQDITPSRRIFSSLLISPLVH